MTKSNKIAKLDKNLTKQTNIRLQKSVHVDSTIVHHALLYCWIALIVDHRSTIVHHALLLFVCSLITASTREAIRYKNSRCAGTTPREIVMTPHGVPPPKKIIIKSINGGTFLFWRNSHLGKNSPSNFPNTHFFL